MVTVKKIVHEGTPKKARGLVHVAQLLANSTSLLREQFARLLDPRRDYDKECGYPLTAEIGPKDYKDLYEREGIARRVVSLVPEESWAVNPTIYETEDPTETAFEEEWSSLVKKFNIFFHLNRIDELSGIGRFGVLFLGIADGKKTNEPVDGVDLKTGKAVEGEAKEAKGVDHLLYIRAFDESAVKVMEWEKDEQSPRYGKPKMYSLQFQETGSGVAIGGGTGTAGATLGGTLLVHWTRVIHVADNCTSSEWAGTPRMLPVFNRILDIRKVLSGSGEMFWRGAFPGFSIEATDPNAVVDTESLKDAITSYANGLKRYMSIIGATVKELAPQVADPTGHTTAFYVNIAITLGIPMRILMGSERGELASSQDQVAWNKRVGKRQSTYLTPMLLRPFIDRLIAMQVLPNVDDYFVDWPDLEKVSDADKAAVAKTRTEALALYVSGNVGDLVGEAEYLSIILELEQEQVDQIMDALEEREKDAPEEDDVVEDPIPSVEEDETDEDEEDTD